jgi:aspartate/methionine/tyrosine aminotransferase
MINNCLRDYLNRSLNHSILVKNMRFANRLKALSRNVFADRDQAKAESILAGKTVIYLSLGSSDLPAPDAAITAIEKSLCDPTTHG